MTVWRGRNRDLGGRGDVTILRFSKSERMMQNKELPNTLDVIYILGYFGHGRIGRSLDNRLCVQIILPPPSPWEWHTLLSQGHGIDGIIIIYIDLLDIFFFIPSWELMISFCSNLSATSCMWSYIKCLHISPNQDRWRCIEDSKEIEVCNLPNLTYFMDTLSLLILAVHVYVVMYLSRYI